MCDTDADRFKCICQTYVEPGAAAVLFRRKRARKCRLTKKELLLIMCVGVFWYHSLSIKSVRLLVFVVFFMRRIFVV